MKNKRGLSITDRLNDDIKYAETIESAGHREILALKALGAADMAVEFNLITYKEWETYIDRIFKMM